MRTSPHKHRVCAVLAARFPLEFYTRVFFMFCVLCLANIGFSLGPFWVCTLVFVTFCYAYFASQTSGLCSAFLSVSFSKVCTLMFVTFCYAYFASQTSGLCSAFPLVFSFLNPFLNQSKQRTLYVPTPKYNIHSLDPMFFFFFCRPKFNPLFRRGGHDQVAVAGALENGSPFGTKTEEDGSINLGLVATVGFGNGVFVASSRLSHSGAREKSLAFFFFSLAPTFFARPIIWVCEMVPFELRHWDQGGKIWMCKNS